MNLLCVAPLLLVGFAGLPFNDAPKEPLPFENLRGQVIHDIQPIIPCRWWPEMPEDVICKDGAVYRLDGTPVPYPTVWHYIWSGQWDKAIAEGWR